MDTEELTAALAEPGHVPEQHSVMATFERKRRRRARQRWSVAGGCLAAAAVIAAFAAVPRSAPDQASSAASGAAATAGPRESANGAASGPGHHMSAGITGPFANECTPASVSQRVTDAVSAGGSVIIANATPAGPAANGRQPVVLRDVQTLRGPRIASGVAAEAAVNFAGGGLRGQVFAIVLPAATGSSATGNAATGNAATGNAATGNAAGSGPAPREVLAAPVSGGTVRFSGARCWDTADTPLATVERLVTGK